MLDRIKSDSSRSKYIDLTLRRLVDVDVRSDANASRMHNCISSAFNARFAEYNLSVASSLNVY